MSTSLRMPAVRSLRIPALRTRLRLPSVGVRAAAGLVAAATVLGATVGTGLARERQQLPTAVTHLTDAVIASADTLACFQGVQDDLFINTAGDIDAASVAAARRRLATCPVAGAVRAAAALVVPPAPPLEPGLWQRLRADIVAGQDDIHRGTLDVRATRAAMVADLADHRHGADVVLAYRAAYADYVQAGQVEADAQRLLARMDARGAGNTGS